MELNEKIKSHCAQNDKVSTLIESALSGLRGVSKNLPHYEDVVLKDLFSAKSGEIRDLVYYPCDIIDLRLVFQQDKVSFSHHKCYFSLDFVKKYFAGEYSLILCFNKHNGLKIFGNVAIEDGDILLAEDDLKRIYYFDGYTTPEDIDIIKSIIATEKAKVDLCVLNTDFVQTKIASQKLQKYVVNIEQISINNVAVKAQNNVEAVRQAVDRKFAEISKLVEGLSAHRPYKYRPEIYIAMRNSPMWNDIVKEASASFNLSKIADTLPVQVNLNPLEQSIFDLILKTKSFYPELRQVQARIAGGFVRDKICGKESDDIDIAVSHISGLDFARYIGKYAKTHNIQNIGEAYEVSLEKSAEPKNPQTKAEEVLPETLKVGGIKIFGQKIEFIRLRKESYTTQSRKPIVVPSDNVKDDVIRRDLKINALYYNLETKEVEDFVGAINDFEQNVGGFFVPKKLSTPTDALKTFTEDPLRMLRVLRFFSKYPNVEIDPAILAVMEQSKDPNSAFSISYKQKVHPSRASKEIKKMMEGVNPVAATAYMFGSDFYKLVFNVPVEWHNIDLDQKSPYHNMTLKNHILKAMSNMDELVKEQGGQGNISNEERGLLILSTMLHDFGKMSPEIRKPKPDKLTGELDYNHYRYIGHENVSADFAKNTMTAMGFSPEEKKFVDAIVQNHMLAHDLSEITKGERSQRHFGRFLKNVGGLWQKIMYHGMADSLSKENISAEEQQSIKQKYMDQIKRIQDYQTQMGERINKPLIDGNKVQSLLMEVVPDLVNQSAFLSGKGSAKPVHYLKFALEKLLEQQHIGKVTTKEQAINFIRSSSRNWLNIWKQQQSQQPKQANTNEPMIKLNDASSGAPSAGFDPAEGGMPWDRINGIYFGPKKHILAFEVGDRVVTRHKPQSEGRIKEINDKEIVIEWSKGKYKGRTTCMAIDNMAIWSSAIEKI